MIVPASWAVTLETVGKLGHAYKCKGRHPPMRDPTDAVFPLYFIELLQDE
ncbi:MAG: hypothetical protein IPK63_14310 [Candidatus Competibacteraceae bacterium]|nr:hypothetical protein [Candidatus Competibacteraceae bacterium]